MLAAFLLGQLEYMEQITAKRRSIFEEYARQLAPLVVRGLIQLPPVPEHCSTNYHMFYVLVADIDERTALIEHLRRAGIMAVFHYVPLHTSPMGRSLGGRDGALPVTEGTSARLIRLPMYYDMTVGEVSDVVREVCAFYRVMPFEH